MKRSPSVQTPRPASRIRSPARVFLVCAVLELLFCASAQAQPRMSTTVSSDRVRAGQPFELQVEVRWSGAPERYVLYPPKLTLSDSIHPGALRQYFDTQGSETVYHYDYTLTADAPGPQSVGPITLDYRELGADAATRPDPIVEEALTVTVQPGGARGWMAQLLLPAGMAVVLIAVVAVRRRRSRYSTADAAAKGQPVLEPSAEELLDEARRRLTAGEDDQVYAVLIRLKPRLPADDDPLPAVDQLEASRLRARYGGASSGHEELDRMLRSVERLVKPSRRDA